MCWQFGVRKIVGMGLGYERQSEQNFPQMAAHSDLGLIGLAGFYRIQDLYMLVDQRAERRSSRKRKQPDAIGVKPGCFNGTPRKFAVDNLGDGKVKRLIELGKAAMVGLSCRCPLFNDQRAELGNV